MMATATAKEPMCERTRSFMEFSGLLIRFQIIAHPNHESLWWVLALNVPYIRKRTLIGVPNVLR